jgi:hypothetical protein
MDAFGSNPLCDGPVDWAFMGATSTPIAAIAKKLDLIVVVFITKA